MDNFLTRKALSSQTISQTRDALRHKDRPLMSLINDAEKRGQNNY